MKHTECCKSIVRARSGVNLSRPHFLPTGRPCYCRRRMPRDAVRACSRLLQCTVTVSYSVYGCFTGKPRGALLLETVQDCVEQSGMEVVKHCSKRRRGAAPPPCSCLQPLIPPFPRIPPPLHFMPAPTTSKTKKPPLSNTSKEERFFISNKSKEDPNRYWGSHFEMVHYFYN